VAAHSAAELTALSAGMWFDPPFPEARLSTLDAVLEALSSEAQSLEIPSRAGLEIHLELKTAIHPYPGLAEAVAALVRGRPLAERVMISSFNHHTLMEVRRCAPELPLAALLDGRMIAPWDYAVRHGFQGIHPEYHSVDAELAGNCRERGLALRAYTVDDPDAARRLMKLGLDGIMTNVPERMLAQRKKP
jgi:glycerophosphoryl diester phosphodiesterase